MSILRLSWNEVSGTLIPVKAGLDPAPHSSNL